MTVNPYDADFVKNAIVADHDLMGDKAAVTHDEATHIGELTEEEKVC